MRTALLILLCALPVFAATPPQLPPPKVPDSFPYRLRTIQRATLPKPNTNYVHCTTNCPVAPKGVRLDWSYSSTDPSLATFKFYGRKDATAPRTLLGTNKSPTWTLWFSNAPAMLVECVAVDRDMAKASDGGVK